MRINCKSKNTSVVTDNNLSLLRRTTVDSSPPLDFLNHSPSLSLRCSPMAVLPIGSHFAPPHKLTKRHAVVATSSPVSLSTRLPQNVSGITTGSRLSRHSVLVRAEDKIRVSSPPPLEEPSQPLDDSSDLEVCVSIFLQKKIQFFAKYPFPLIDQTNRKFIPLLYMISTIRICWKDHATLFVPWMNLARVTSKRITSPRRI